MPYIASTTSRQGLTVGHGRPWRSQQMVPKTQLMLATDGKIPPRLITESEGIAIPKIEQDLCEARDGNSRIARLRHTIKKMEAPFCRAAPAALSLGVPEIRRH